MEKKILITGACGFIGLNLSKFLLKKKFKNLLLLDNFSTSDNKTLQQFKKYKINFFNIDLRNKFKLKKIFSEWKIDTIIHLAGYTDAIQSNRFKKRYKENNIDTTKNLLALSKDFNVKKIIFASTAAVYGDQKNNQPIKENSNLKPVNYYGKTKLICEDLIKKNFQLKNQKNYIILRFFNVVGRNFSDYKKNFSKNLFNILYEKFQTNKKFFIFGKNLKTKDGTPVRDFVYVDDLVEVIYKTIILKRKSYILNVGYNVGFTVLEVYKSFAKVFKKKIPLIFLSPRKIDPKVSVACNKKLKKNLRWKPKYENIDIIVKKFIYEKRKILKR